MGNLRSRTDSRRRRRLRPQATDGSGQRGADPSKFIGVDQSDTSESGTLIGEVFNGPTFDQLTIPDRVAPGERFEVKGKVTLDAAPLISRRCRVRVEASFLTDPQFVDLGSLNNGQTTTFSTSLVAPSEVGKVATVRLVSQFEDGPLGFKDANDTGPNRVEIVSGASRSADKVLGLAPTLLGGAGAGLVAARLSGARRDQRRYALIGAGIAAGGRLYANRFGPFEVVPSVDIPTTSLLAVGAAGIGVAAALRTTGVGSILSSLGGGAGDAIDRGRQAIGGGSAEG